MSNIKDVIIDAFSVNKNPACEFKGLGAITANNSSRLLIDYKAKNPDAYEEIMEALFRKDYGASLSHVKIELGADVNSSSGTEPCVKRYCDEKADVTRGAGFIFASDAKKINPDITVDLLRWGEPAWVRIAFEQGKEYGYEARYRWYKETMEAAFDTYGLEFDYISADGNETEKADGEWIVYFSERLKNETDLRYDYSKIRIIASDEPGTRNIAESMINNEDLRNAVDVIGLHYTTYGDENTAVLNEKYGKEIWYSEGIAPCNISELSVNADGNGISGINSLTDVTNRIINSYCHGKMTMYEYQPAVAAYYTGSNYAPKQLIAAEEPWSGYYSIGSGLWGAAHITHFIRKGWKYVDSACFGDGNENHFITDTTSNYMTLMSDEGDYTVILSNDSDTPRKYRFTLKNMIKPDSELNCIETRGPESGGKYNENWFRFINRIVPTENHGEYSFILELKPFSVMTVTTLSAEHVNGIETVKIPEYKSSRLPLPYIDSFNYNDDFLRTRGNAPLYTTDQGGAFEIRRDGEENVLVQLITSDMIPSDWRFRNTPDPALSLGDDKWSDYTLKAEIKFADTSPDNYAAIGIRYNSAVTCDYTAESGYQFRIYPDGKWQLKYMDSVIESGYEYNISSENWNFIRISAEGRRIKCYVNKELVCDYLASVPMITSGRVSIYSAFFRNEFRNLAVLPILGSPVCCERIDCLSGVFCYSDGWKKNAMDSFRFYNRTSVSSGNKNDFFTFEFSGENFSLLGEAENLRLKIEVDDRILAAGYTIEKCGSKQVFYCKRGLASGNHYAKVTVLAGSLKFDSAEVSVNSHEIINVHNKTAIKAKKTKKSVKERKLRKSTVVLGAGIAAAAAGIFIAVKKIKNFSSKKLDK
ncbi:MAG: family 16 glycoside hydrolase [Porcipelethomonas sp.]